ncbi:hypothetical protein DH2020_036160 [Rehmannia glutinosa]|uniref:Phosphatidylinositol glycan anchor biosynthesis class U protein n=1 Tax=Rehmannia glutinosa TaxID=99300 RepID=A0ABR0V6P9_REHGL
MEEENKIGSKIKKLGFWKWAVASIIFRLILSYFSENLNLSTRPEVSTPLTSLRRRSMYHGSPLLLSVLGPLTVKKFYQRSSHPCNLTQSLAAHGHNLKSLGLDKLFKDIEILPSGDIAGLVYLWNPFTIVSSIGFNTSPIENLFVILSLYGASAVKTQRANTIGSLWVGHSITFVSLSLGFSHSGDLFTRTYGFVLSVEDLSPNIGVLWYFFAEVFDFFRNFFLIVFHVNILFMILPLAIRLNHRPCFLVFVYLAISSMLKSYPSVGDSALYLSLLVLFLNELAEMQFSFFLFCGYVGVSLLSPVMHNIWIWRGTGNANFYFATAMAYACFQIILVVESVSAMLNYDRKIKKLCNIPKV